MSSTFVRRLAFWLPSLALLLILAAAVPFSGAGLHNAMMDDPTPKAKVVPKPLADPVINVSAGIDGEIYPAIANYSALQKSSQRQLPTVTVKVTNPGDAPVLDRVHVSVPGWSDQEIQTVEVAPGATRTLAFAPTFLPRLYSNREITPATAAVTATDAQGRTVFSTTVPIRLRATEDMYWGAKFRYAPFIAAWVTPHDPQLEEVLSRAKEFMPGRRLPGYEEWKNTAGQTNSTYMQAKAIYNALQHMGISYVKSSLTFGNNIDVSERVRVPRETLRRESANCIDGAVLYAAAFENLGMQPAIILVPGHAYVGVREAEDSQHYLYIETSLTGRASFENAVLAASRGISKVPADKVMLVGITQARAQGIYPMPLPRMHNESVAELESVK